MANRRNIASAFCFVIPVVLCVIALRLWPAALAFAKSFEVSSAGDLGFDNYINLFGDSDFLNSLRVTILFLLVVNPLQVGLALALALLMNAALPAVGLWRTIVFLPIAIPPSVSAVIWGVAYRPDGPLNAVLAILGIEPQRFLTSPEQALSSIIVIVSWVGVGYWMTFIIAGLQDIPKSLYEAIMIDGANAFQRFWYVTLPLLIRPITFVLIANTVANFLVFAPVQILTQGGPRGATDLIMYQIYTRAFDLGDMQTAYAATVILVLVVVVIVSLQFYVMGKQDREARHR